TVTNTGDAPVHLDLTESAGAFTSAASAAFASSDGTAASASPKAPWMSLAPLPVSVWQNAALSAHGKVYSIGGNSKGHTVATGFVYDPVTSAWAPITPMPVARESVSAAWVGGKIVVTGGYTVGYSVTALTQAYSPLTDRWTTLAPNPRPSADASAAVLDGRLYLVGGCDQLHGCGRTAVQVYDPATDTWHPAAPYPVPVEGLACGGIGLLYCVGGDDGESGVYTMYAYDRRTDTWALVPGGGLDVTESSYAVSGDRLLLTGGLYQDVPTAMAWSFDPARGAWTALPPSNRKVYRGAGACGFYSVGGLDGVSRTDQTQVLPGYDDCADGGQDVAWLAETPASLDLAPGASTTVSVHLDASAVTQAGRYEARLNLRSGSPYPTSSVTVAMVVTPRKR
ncbi:MAG: hypothetical protein ABI890_05805, partial [Lapillicoccus sp.]